MSPIRSVLFVCMGNICRSPLAEGIARARLPAAGVTLRLDSAGTERYHVGQPSDPRARAVARRYGTPIDDLRARQICSDDFHEFDLILTADAGNIARLRHIAPAQHAATVAILPVWAGLEDCIEIPDPYYADEQAFDQVYLLLQRCMDGLLDRLTKAA